MTVLVVDDSPVSRLAVRKELEAGGLQVVDVANGAEALARVGAIAPQLITLDVSMPGMDGFEVCARLRQLTGAPATVRDVPVVFLTATDSHEQRDHGFTVGATDFIAKPFLPGQLLQLVQRILNPARELVGTLAMVVEDSGLMRNALARRLEQLGVKVLGASNGEQALALAREHGEALDVVVTDLEMPIMRGDELCRRIKQNLGLRDLPVIVVSAMNNQSSVLDLFKNGATDYLAKPFSIEEFIARVSVHLRSRLYQRAMQANMAELTQLNKLKDDFLAITSHDLRSPLTGILGYADLLLEGGIGQQQQSDFLRRIQSAGERLLEMINDVLDLSRIQAGSQELKLRPISLGAILRTSLDTVQYMGAKKKLALAIDDRCGEAGSIIQGEKGSLLRIVNNLLSNAIKFTESGGSVTVGLARTPDGAVTMSVTDTGIGIPAEHLPHLFDAYSRASQPGTSGETSTGLGMSITRELVDKHGATISVESVVGQGTAVQVTFPATGRGAAPLGA